MGTTDATDEGKRKKSALELSQYKRGKGTKIEALRNAGGMTERKLYRIKENFGRTYLGEKKKKDGLEGNKFLKTENARREVSPAKWRKRRSYLEG